jgi:hypothetical protein
MASNQIFQEALLQLSLLARTLTFQISKLIFNSLVLISSMLNGTTFLMLRVIHQQAKECQSKFQMNLSTLHLLQVKLKSFQTTFKLVSIPSK